MTKHLSLTLALALSVLAITPQLASAQTQPAPQTCATPQNSDEAAYEEMGIRHPKAQMRQCYPDGSLKIWTQGSDDTTRVVEHNDTGTIVRDIAVYHNVGISGWMMVAQTRNSKNELVEQIWASSDTTSNKLPTTWTLISVGVYAGQKDAAHPLAVVMFNGNPSPILVRTLLPNGESQLQRYRPDGTLEYSTEVVGDGKQFGNRKNFTQADNVRLPPGVVDPSWSVMPNIKDLPDLLPPPPPYVRTQVIDINDHIPSSIPLRVGERVMVKTENAPGAAAITSVTCTDSNGKGSPTLDPVPGSYPNSVLKAVQPGTCLLTISYTHNPRDPAATLEGKTTINIEP